MLRKILQAGGASCLQAACSQSIATSPEDSVRRESEGFLETESALEGAWFEMFAMVFGFLLAVVAVVGICLRQANTQSRRNARMQHVHQPRPEQPPLVVYVDLDKQTAYPIDWSQEKAIPALDAQLSRSTTAQPQLPDITHETTAPGTVHAGRDSSAADEQLHCADTAARASERCLSSDVVSAPGGAVVEMEALSVEPYDAHLVCSKGQSADRDPSPPGAPMHPDLSRETQQAASEARTLRRISAAAEAAYMLSGISMEPSEAELSTGGGGGKGKSTDGAAFLSGEDTYPDLSREVQQAASEARTLRRISAAAEASRRVSGIMDAGGADDAALASSGQDIELQEDREAEEAHEWFAALPVGAMPRIGVMPDASLCICRRCGPSENLLDDFSVLPAPVLDASAATAAASVDNGAVDSPDGVHLSPDEAGHRIVASQDEQQVPEVSGCIQNSPEALGSSTAGAAEGGMNGVNSEFADADIQQCVASRLQVQLSPESNAIEGAHAHSSPPASDPISSSAAEDVEGSCEFETTSSPHTVEEEESSCQNSENATDRAGDCDGGSAGGCMERVVFTSSSGRMTTDGEDAQVVLALQDVPLEVRYGAVVLGASSRNVVLDEEEVVFSLSERNPVAGNVNRSGVQEELPTNDADGNIHYFYLKELRECDFVHVQKDVFAAAWGSSVWRCR